MWNTFILKKKKNCLRVRSNISYSDERTMCTFLGTAGKINENDVNSDAIKKVNLFF